MKKNTLSKYLILKIGQLKNEPVVKNIFSLGILQLTNYIIPLITIPYLTRILGLEKFGLIALAQGLISFFLIITDFGFNTVSTRAISIHKENRDKLSEIFSITILAQAMLGVISFVVLLLIVFLTPKFNTEKTLFINAFSLVLAQWIFPIWFFQGMQEMKFITYFNLISKGVMLTLLLVFVTRPEQYMYVPFLYAAGNILSGITSHILIRSRFKIHFVMRPFQEILTNIKESFPVFISAFSIVSGSNSGILVLGFFGSDRVVGMYSIAEKVFQMARQILVVYSQAIYPRICQLAIKSMNELRYFLRIYFIPFLIIVTLMCFFVLLSAGFITKLIIGRESEEVTFLIRVLMLIPVIVCLNIPFYQTLLALDFRNIYMRVFVIGSLINVFLNFLLVPFFNSLGTCLSLIISEIFITSSFIFYIEKNRETSLLTNE